MSDGSDVVGRCREWAASNGVIDYRCAPVETACMRPSCNGAPVEVFAFKLRDGNVRISSVCEKCLPEVIAALNEVFGYVDDESDAFGGKAGE